MKRNLVGKIFGIGLVFVMIGSMVGYLPSTINTIDASPANENQPPLIGPGELGYNNVRNLARTSDGALHCVYSRSDGSYTQIYYSCSSDGGETWTEEQITDAPHNHGFPSIAIDSNDDIHVVWSHCQEPRDWGKTCTIQYRVKKATTWQPIEDVITSYGSTPSIAIDSEDNIHLVLSGFWGGAYNCDDVKYMKRTSSGWSSPEKVSTQCWASNPAIAIDNDDNVHVVYRNSPLSSPSGGIRYREKTASGWGSEVVIEPNDSDATNPSIAIDSNNYVHIVWWWINPNKDEWAIKYVKFTDSWQPIEILEGPTSYHQGYPSISVDMNDNLHVVWEGKHSGSPNCYQIRYRKYTTSWSSVENLTSASVNQTNPNLIWAWWPTVDNLRTNSPENGYAFVWNDGSNIRFYKSSDLEWEAGPSWTFTPPYNDCRTSTSHTPSPPQGDPLVLSKGFSTAVGTCDANVGTFKYKIASFGGTSGGIGYGRKIPPPNQAASAEAGLLLDFVPPFTGDLHIEANLTLNGKAEASAGSGLAASINAVDEVGGSILDWLTGKKVSVLLTVLKALKANTVAKARTDAFIQVSGGATGKVETEITPSLGALFPWGYYSQSALYDNQAVHLSTVVHVTQGQAISISVGTKSHVESWGWASSVVNLALSDRSCQVNSIVLSKQ